MFKCYFHQNYIFTTSRTSLCYDSYILVYIQFDFTERIVVPGDEVSNLVTIGYRAYNYVLHKK